MNDLNSVLIEGVVSQAPTTPPNDNDGRCRFRITSRRFVSQPADSTISESLTVLTVDTFGALSERCHEYLTVGRKVRAVGHLSQEDTDTTGELALVLVAEHLEFRPQVSRRTAEPEALVTTT